MAELEAYFAQRIDEILDLLHQLVEIESPSTDKTAVDRIGAFVAQLARGIGAEVSIVPHEQQGNQVLARWGNGSGQFLVLCHLDTVWPFGTLRQRPWRVENGRVFGPGCLDDKAGTAIVLTAMKGLRDLGITPVHPVTALFNSDEEIGSPASRHLITREAAQAKLVLCMEPSLPDGSLKVQRKGTARYTITALGQSAHSGANHEQGINAIEELAHQIVRIQGMTDYDAGTTVNVGSVRGGTRANVVPDQAQIDVDVRLPTKKEGERMVAAIKALEPVLPGARLHIEGGRDRPPRAANGPAGRSPISLVSSNSNFGIITA